MPPGNKLTLTVVTPGTNYQITTFMTMEAIIAQIEGVESSVWASFDGLTPQDEALVVKIRRRNDKGDYLINGFTVGPWHPQPMQPTGIPMTPEMMARMRGTQ